MDAGSHQRNVDQTLRFSRLEVHTPYPPVPPGKVRKTQMLVQQNVVVPLDLRRDGVNGVIDEVSICLDVDNGLVAERSTTHSERRTT